MTPQAKSIIQNKPGLYPAMNMLEGRYRVVGKTLIDLSGVELGEIQPEDE